MDFEAYATLAARLVNAELGDLAALRRTLEERPWYADRVTRADLATLQKAQPRLRAAFVHATRGQGAEAVHAINALLADVPVAPRVSGHDAQSWHLHVTSGATHAEDLLAEAAMGLAVTVIDRGPDRLGTCAQDDCDNVFVDGSTNRSRRYCSERCASRANVAAFRARRRAVDAGAAASE